MPIEIRELQINVTVSNPQPQADAAGGNSGDGDASSNEESRKSLIEHCIEQAVAIINNKKER